MGISHAQIAGAIVVYPITSTLEIGSTRQFTAYVPISPNKVVWSVNNVVGGSATLGTISSSGFYTPPPVAPTPNLLKIKATSVAFPSSVGTATLTVTRKYPWLWSAYPSSLATGNYEVSLNGSNFASDSQALANGMAVTTRYVSATKLVVKGNAAIAGSLEFSVRQPDPGAVTGNSVSVPVAVATVMVAVAPSTATVPLATTRSFVATVSGSANTVVTWSVNGTVGGTAIAGLISSAGVYTAPTIMPATRVVTVRATSMATVTAWAQSTVTLTTPPITVTTVAVVPTSASMFLGTSKTFAATVTGNANPEVTWSVNGTPGGSTAVGTITATGDYTAPAAMPASSTVTIRAASVAVPSVSGQSMISLFSPLPSQVWLSGARFLDQSSFGSSPPTLARVQQLGIPAFLDEQFSLPETGIPVLVDNSMGTLKTWTLYNYCTARDQLRQRVAYALSQILVTSANKLVYANEILPWMQILSRNAFGNYRTLLREISTSPSMGKYLDLANSMKPGLAGGANENYPREFMQIFTIGLWELNPDGSQKKDGNGQSIPTYTQATVAQVARALTGWTYATAPGATARSANWEYFAAPMETRPQNHDGSAKSFLGCNVPANQTVDQDLDSVIDCAMNHANIGPFIATRLIRSLVTSNPSSGYIQRIADVFANDGAGVRGNLRAVVRAILLDPEARNDSALIDQGRLKEPILQICGLLRALNGNFTANHQLTYLFDYMSQSVLSPPSVFSWFSPLYHVPKSPLFGPEFQIYSSTDAALRGNFFFDVIHYPASDMVVDLSPFQAYGNDMQGLVEAANQALLHGRMPPEMKPILINAAVPGYDAKTRIETVLYLTALSGQFAVQY